MAGRRVLLEGERFSSPHLWALQRAYFERQGIGAWRHGVVPHYVTSNPFVGAAYARIVAAFVRDCLDAGVVDRAQPLHVLELGAGPGRFAFQFLRHYFGGDGGAPRVPGVALRYVMTDVVEGNVAFWPRQPSFEPFVRDGRLDVARFDATEPRPVRLRLSGDVLAPGSLANPLVVVANYLLDSIPSDRFRVRRGRLYEGLARATVAAMPEGEGTDIFENLRLRFRYRPTTTDYYPEPELNALFERYRRTFDDASVLFPAAGLRCLTYLAGLSSGPLLVLSCDRGYCTSEQVAGRDSPDTLVVGGVVLDVNYHAVGEFVRARGGRVLHPRLPAADLVVAAYVLSDPPLEAPGMALAYREAVDEGGPHDFYTVRKAIAESLPTWSAEQIVAHLRLAGFDPTAFRDCFPRLAELAGGVAEPTRAELRDAVDRVWDAYLPIGETYDLAFDLGSLLYALGCYREAAGYFERSLEMHGANAGTAYNLAACRLMLGEKALATRALELAAAADPSFEPLDDLRRRVEELAAD